MTNTDTCAPNYPRPVPVGDGTNTVTQITTETRDRAPEDQNRPTYTPVPKSRFFYAPVVCTNFCCALARGIKNLVCRIAQFVLRVFTCGRYPSV